jgi:hypothetical protein
MARCADMYDFKIAKKLGIKIKEFPANWNELGKKAGFVRNI